MRREGIALLITLFFIMAISIAIGVGLKQINRASQSVNDEKLLLQTSVIFDDVLEMLKSSQELDMLLDSNLTGDSFEAFLSGYSIPAIPLGESGIVLGITLKSARGKINVNTIKEHNATEEALRYYFSNYMINPNYVDILIDMSSGVSIDGSYASDIFYEYPELYRDKIVSPEQLQIAKDFYVDRYRDNSLSNINQEKLFSFSSEVSEYKIDLNCVNVDVLEVLLNDKNRALQLLPKGSFDCNSLVCTLLSKEELEGLKKYEATCTVQPYIKITVDVIQNKQSAKISFEYDLLKKRGYNFVYEI